MQGATTDTHLELTTDQRLSHGQLALVTLGRFALSTAYRIVYPLQPFLALHLNVELRTVSLLLTVQVLASLTSLVGGVLTDTRGERTTMSWGLGLFCVGTVLCALASNFAGFLAGYALIGLAVALYQPAAQSYLSARTPYAYRGRALGIFETSWAAAALLGVAPLMQLIQATGDATPAFLALLVAGVLSLVLIRFALPPTHQARRTGRHLDWSALRAPGVLSLLAFLLLSTGAVDTIFVIQGAWLKRSFGADEAQLGQVFGLLGIAELIGSVGSTLLVDRIGKKSAVVAGFVLTALCMASLPLTEGRWLWFLPLFFLFDLCFEFAIVSAFPLASGVAPAARGTVMAMSVAAIGVGRALVSLISEPLWSQAGVLMNALVGAGMMLAGVTLCLIWVREREAAPASGA